MKTILALIASAAWVACSFAGQAPSEPSYPVRAIRVIVPFVAGGGADLVARTTGQRLGELLGQNLVVDNRVGASGDIGTELAARAAPDGYTILLGYVGNLAIAPAMKRRLPFDPLRDFAPVTHLVDAPNILVVHPSVPATNLQQFIAYVKANPGKLSFSSAVSGSPGHLAGELLNREAGMRMEHIPYKGAAQALVDVLAGQVQAMFAVSTVLPHIKSGKLRALATTGRNRTPVLPQLPTIAESGFTGFEAAAWYGYLAPAGTPAGIIRRLHNDSVNALKTPEVKARLEAAGFTIAGSSPDEFATFIRAEIKKWGPVIESAAVKPE